VSIRIFKADRQSDFEPMRGMTAIQFLLVGIGIVVLFSASWYFARTVFGDPFRIWRRQFIWIMLGVLAAITARRLPHVWFRRSIPTLVWIAIGLNLLTYVPGIGYTSGGARRWIVLAGLTFQPSEFTRLVLILYLARMLEKNESRLNNFKNGVLPSMLIVIVLIVTVYFQNDFSTAAYLFLLSLILFYVAGVPRRIITFIAGTGFLALIGMLFSRFYRLERVKAWFNPVADPTGTGYQLLKARSALERGGLWGRGLGRGEVKLGGLPAAHSDFVIAVVGEETGFIGIVAVLLLFTLFAIKGWLTAARARDSFSRWVLFGMVTAIYWQVLINFSVVSGVIPTTGIPLPLFSAGGSAAFITLIMFGIMFNLSEAERW